MKEDYQSKPLTEEEQLLAAGYVLNDLTDDEFALAERLLCDNLDFYREVKSLEASFNLLPTAIAPKLDPPPQVRDRLLAAYDAWATPDLPRAIAPQPSLPWPWMVAVLTTLITAVVSFQNLKLRQELRLAQRVDPQRVAAILQQPKSRLIALRGEGNSTAAGTLLFTPGRWQEVVLSVGDLPPLPPEQVYRMWLTLANDQVLYCGEFKTDPQGAIFLRLTPPQVPPKGVKATGIFVTVDEASSPKQPTGPRVLEGRLG